MGTIAYKCKPSKITRHSVGQLASQELFRKAQHLKSKGLSTYEIADELKVQPDTVVWLLLRGKERAARPAPNDIFVDWSTIGSHGSRLAAVAVALADLIRESIRLKDMDEPDVLVAVEGSGMVLGVAVAKELEKPFAAIRPKRHGERKLPGLVNPNFLDISGKKVLIADAVLRAGETHLAAVHTLKEAKSKAVGVVVLVNKSGKTKIDGIPLKSLIQILPVTSQ